MGMSSNKMRFVICMAFKLHLNRRVRRHPSIATEIPAWVVKDCYGRLKSVERIVVVITARPTMEVHATETIAPQATAVPVAGLVALRAMAVTAMVIIAGQPTEVIVTEKDAPSAMVELSNH